jgi:hypothetical protein
VQKLFAAANEVSKIHIPSLKQRFATPSIKRAMRLLQKNALVRLFLLFSKEYPTHSYVTACNRERG